MLHREQPPRPTLEGNVAVRDGFAIDNARVIGLSGGRRGSRPEFKAMFLDDLLSGSRFETSAPLAHLVLFRAIPR